MSGAGSRADETQCTREPLPWLARLVPLAILLVAWLAYSNGAAGVFVFDDHTDITDNVAIRQPWPPWRVIVDQGQSGVSGRPLVALSYALNYEACGYSTAGWHWVNVALHALTALAVYGCVRRALASEPFALRWGTRALAIASAVALVFAAHPLSTGVIMYRGQRVESMMALFFTLTMYCALRAFAAPQSRWWPRLAVVSCALGTGCKEVIVGAPLLVALYDASFVARSWSAAFRARKRLYLGLFGTWALIALWVVLAQGRSESVGFGYEGMGVWQYLTTQAWAVPHYLRLALWPDPLIFDFGVQPISEVGRWLPRGLLVLALLALTAWGLAKRHGLAFLGAWWFVILAPSSSVLPIVTELIVEHRAYLPSAALLLGAALSVAWVLERLQRPLRLALGFAMTLAALALFVPLTRARNATYHSELGLWADTVAKLPTNARAHASYANDLRVAGRVAEAGEHYAKAVELAPNDPYWHANYGTWLTDQNRLDEAIAELERARELLPTYGMTLQNLGIAYQRRGESDKALDAWLAGLEVGTPAVAYVALQVHTLLAQRGREREALAALRRGVQWARGDAELLSRAARALLEARDPALRAPSEALAYAQRAFTLSNGTDAAALELAGQALTAEGRGAEAAQLYRQAAAVWRVLNQPARADECERRARTVTAAP
ncbi:MAG: hypothetical protein IT454_03220 [Planctomycetes bacterium]|nr:hypothetical protein [Planctomycetota bacterium]